MLATLNNCLAIFASNHEFVLFDNKAWFPSSQLRPQERPISGQNKAISVKDDRPIALFLCRGRGICSVMETRPNSAMQTKAHNQGGSKHRWRTFGISYEDCYARESRVSSAISVCDN